MVVPGWGTQACVLLQGAVNAATPGREFGPVRVELLGAVKSTWNFHRFSAFAVVSTFMRKFGAPAGGGVAPSRSEGKRLSKALESWKHTRAGAAEPVNIALRSNAHASGPMKLLPF